MAKIIIDGSTIELVSGVDVSIDGDGNITVNNGIGYPVEFTGSVRKNVQQKDLFGGIMGTVDIAKYKTAADMVRDVFTQRDDQATVNIRGYSHKTIRAAFYSMGGSCSMKKQGKRGFVYDICRTT